MKMKEIGLRWGDASLAVDRKPWPLQTSLSMSALMLVMAHNNLYLDNLHQASGSHPFSRINASVNADAEADADAQCGQGIRFTPVICHSPETSKRRRPVRTSPETKHWIMKRMFYRKKMSAAHRR